MAITVNSVDSTNAMPSAPQRASQIDVDLDNSYPDGGYDITDDLPDGCTIVHSETVRVYASDETANYWVRVDEATKHVMVYDETNGVRGAQAGAGDNLSSVTGLVIGIWHH